MTATETDDHHFRASEVELDNILSHLPKNMVRRFGTQQCRELLSDKRATAGIDVRFEDVQYLIPSTECSVNYL